MKAGVRRLNHKERLDGRLNCCKRDGRSEALLTVIVETRGQSNLTKNASRGAHSPVRGHPGGRKLYH